jgi:hypothetical protein
MAGGVGTQMGVAASTSGVGALRWPPFSCGLSLENKEVDGKRGCI